ncbi:MAG: PLP-dependent aspartate aminotransferase family protein [Acidaminococcus provencensis]|jgi:cystathionine gamma-synthase/cystathionine beta-lyase|uniref:trans-sulfuration enzyme family protein n=1 Tax=Acidaminococcus provencensis TaxID=2058289 RepID=UPI0023F416FD|nr:PLP-dependent aspartate aminotransferase family protein [Acidaminococcus provencensis]MCH4097069.1 PLP-dependent aspartate aminotransferase family protein [Acidaminococcus provencensis]
MKFNTACIHGDGPNDALGAVSPAIYCTSTFAHPGLGKSTGYAYTRESNPTHERLEKVMTTLEGGVDALCFSTGMAAIDAVMRLFGTGDHIITGFDLYGGSFRMFRSVYEPLGLSFSAVHTSDLKAVEAAITLATKAIYLETPTNPTMEITDLKALHELAAAHNLLVIVDNTFLTPYFQRPLELGADIVLHSGTKYLAGHNDILAGFVISKDPEIAARLRLIYKTTGAMLSVFDAWLMLRSLRTLPLRMKQHENNAQHLAKWLQEQPQIVKVLYPGLPDHPGYAIQKKQASGFGGMISFYVKTAEAAKTVLESVKLIQFAESLGGAESLITYPITQTHADLTPEEAEEKGITHTLLRFSVGLEDWEDLRDDLAQVLAKL